MVTVAFSQPPGGQRQRRSPEERAKQSTEWMKKELNLNEKEAKKVQEINLKYAIKQQEKMQKVMQSSDRSQMRTIMNEINEAKKKELKSVLREKKFDLYLKKLEERSRNRNRGRYDFGGRGVASGLHVFKYHKQAKTNKNQACNKV